MLVSLSNVSFGYTGETILEGISFQVNPKERLGVVGPNGHGKSTLLRLIAGTLPVESGERSVRRSVDIGYLRQSQEFPDDISVHDLLLQTFPEVLQLEHELERVQERMAGGDDSEATLTEFGELQHRFEEVGGYTLESRAQALAHEVGFSDEDLLRPAGSLSGGERARFEVARVLLREPDVLLLDEPTNHLDLLQLEKLEKRVADYPKSVLIVSHDRAFLRATCESIVDVEHKGLVRYVGGYDSYREQREQRLKKALDDYVRQQEKIEKTEDFIRRNIAGQKTKQAQARRKMLEKLERVDRPEDVWEAVGNLGIAFERGEHPGGRETLRARKLTAGYEGAEPVVADFDWTVHRGERIGVVGPNGAGKTTLVKTLLGRLRPLGGNAELGYQVTPGYLDQKLVDGLDLSQSLVEEVRSVRPDLTIDQARDELARFRFFGEDVFKAVGALSGGERCRIALLKVSLKDHNLLVFDEPTNHLDIPSCEVLEHALEQYDGTLLVISHDRDFLDRVAQKILWIEDGTARIVEGNYSEARRKLKGVSSLSASAPSTAPAPKAESKAKTKTVDSKPGPSATAAKATEPSAASGDDHGEARGPSASEKKAGKVSHAETKRRRAEVQKQKNRLKQVESDIEQFEARIGELAEQLTRPPAGDWEKLHALTNEEQELRARLERRYAEWERLTNSLET